MIIQGTAIKGMTVSSSAATVEPDSYFNLVSLLLPGNGTNGAQNNTFVDSSTNNFTVTRNGNTTQGTFSPFSQTGWSNYFDGGANSLTVAANTALDLTGNFTIEFWAWAVDSTTNYMCNGTQSGSGCWRLTMQPSNGSVVWSMAINTWAGVNISSTTGLFSPNQWVHFAVTRSGNDHKVFINGTVVASTTVAGSLVNTGRITQIGYYTDGNGTYFSKCFFSNLRIIKGTALYTANFTPPTAPLTAVSGTSLLTCQSNRFIDNSANAFAITVGGIPSVQAFSPFDPTTAYSTTTVGGSAYFDGSGDYLDAGAQTAFAFGTGSWTVEAWVYVTSLSSEILLFDTRSSVSTAGVGCRIGTDGTLSYSGSANNPLTSTAIKTNEWNHIAWSYDGTTLSGYINGVRGGTATPSFNISQNNGIVGRVGFTAASYMSGYISSLRVVKGSAVYSGTSFSVPTAPLTAISGTSLLLSGTNGGITDATAKNVLETVGGAAISTAQSKFGGSSMYFDGSGDYLVAPAQAITSLTGDFTVEFWAYRPSAGNNFFYTTGDDALSSGIAIYIGNSGNNLRVYNANGVVIDAALSGISFPTSTWTHIALVRSSGVVKLFAAGSQAGSNWSSSTTFSGKVYLATEFNNGSAGGTGNCYLQDFRITNGYARYTANFTPPTAAFPTQ